jgi:long-chain acyl-CoA synthetase
MFYILEKFLYHEEKLSDKLFLHQAMGETANTWTWKQAGEQARRMVTALRGMGLQEGDKVAILSKNCAEWIIADIAIMMGGFVSVPLYATITAPTIRMLLEHSGCKAVFVGKLDNFKDQAPGLIPEVPAIYVGAYGHTGSLMFEKLVAKNEPATHLVSVQEDALVTLLYTSGTTGKPKGVMHSAANFRATMDAVRKRIPIPENPNIFSYLPLSHVAERMGVEFVSISYGGTLYFAHTLDSFAKDLSAVQPDLFFAVPRIWAKFKEKINEKMPDAKLSKLLKIPLLNIVIRKKIKKALGLSKATVIYSAAAPLSVDLILWYRQLKINILQAYGMTEDCVLGHYCVPDEDKVGAVGKPLPGLQTRLSNEGEIQVKSTALMMGYYKEPELTAEMFTEDGFLKTGDKGHYDKDGFLFITGRVKDQFKTDKGKYISPSSIEMRLMDDIMVEQACVVGMGIPQPIGLIVLSESAKSEQRAELTANLNALRQQINLQLEPHEKMEKLVIIPEAWTVENGLMTPTMKIKRNEVENIYQKNYRDWFHHSEPVIWV